MNAALIERNGSLAAQIGVYQTRDVEEARLHMSGVFRSHRLYPGLGDSLAMQHEQLRIGSLSAHWLRYGSNVTMSAPQMDCFYLFQFTLQGSCEIMHGCEPVVVGKDYSYAVDPNRPLSKRWREDCKQFILHIPRDQLETFAARETGVESVGRLAFTFRPIATASGPRGVLRFVEALREYEEGKESFAHFRVVRHLETTIMSLILASFPHSLREEYDRAARPCTPYYVRRAEQYLCAHARDPIGVEDLVAVAGISARSLFAGFKRFRNTTPMAYLKAVRLDLAHADLATADPARSTVTNIALGCGFTHMSKFARDFRARYGTSPAKMLNRNV